MKLIHLSLQWLPDHKLFIEVPVKDGCAKRNHAHRVPVL